METNTLIKDLVHATARLGATSAQGKVLEVLQYPNPKLREVSTPVLRDVMDSDFQQFVADMVATMNQFQARGLAAIQVGVAERVLVVRDNDGLPVVIINPVVVDADVEFEVMEKEGCLSFPGLFIDVRRPQEVTVEYIDDKGVRRTSTADKSLGRAIQHEIGHLDGVLFTDLIPKFLRAGVLKKYEQEKNKAWSRPHSSLAKAKKTKADRKKEQKKRSAGKNW